MNKADTEKQIAQMVGFIKKEAEEKASDIKREGDNEANARKLERVRTMKTQLKEEYTLKKKTLIVAQRIERSKRKNDARVQQMRARDRVIKQLKDEVLEQLAEVSKNAKYPELIRYLIAQGLMIITENVVDVQCRKEDEKIVRNELNAAKKLYVDFIREQTSVTPKLEVRMSNEWLPPGPVKGSKALHSCGGVVLSARNGTIVCKNTLDSRLDLCFTNLIPAIRGLLFGVRERLANVESEIEKAAKEQQHKLKQIHDKEQEAKKKQAVDQKK
jgi:V-type H+-transporting ATPase subunit E